MVSQGKAPGGAATAVADLASPQAVGFQVVLLCVVDFYRLRLTNGILCLPFLEWAPIIVFAWKQS